MKLFQTLMWYGIYERRHHAGACHVYLWKIINFFTLSLYVMAAYCKWQKIVYQNIFIHFIHEKLLEDWNFCLLVAAWACMKRCFRLLIKKEYTLNVLWAHETSTTTTRMAIIITTVAGASMACHSFWLF